MTTTKKTTTGSPLQAFIDSITHPEARAALQQKHDEANANGPDPSIAAFTALEAKHGAGKVPLEAIHESPDIDFDTKKLLFSMAGVEYDGNGPR